MTEQELRALVRDAVARHLGRPAQSPSGPSSALAPCRAMHQAPPHESSGADPGQAHISHGVYRQLVNVSETCVIEPSVGCDHCGYCRSHGH